MRFLVAGLNYRTASTELLERVAVNDRHLPDLLLKLHRQLGEALVLSTCNRTEVYTTGEDFAVERERLMQALGDMSDLTETEIAEVAYVYGGDEAIRHAIRVTCGLDSMVIGEHQIAGQVQTALRAAGEAGSVDTPLSRLFHFALRSSRRIREDTGIGRSRLTVSSIGVQLVERAVGSLRDRRVLLVGAGETGKLAARTLGRMGAGRLTVAGRNAERTERVAAELGGDWVLRENLVSAMANSDVVISATAANETIITTEMVEQALKNSDPAPSSLVMLDLAMPRDIDASVGELPGVTLYGLPDLQAIADEHRAERADAAAEAETIIESDVPRFNESLTALATEPVIRALGAHAEEIRQRELHSGLRRLRDLNNEERTVIESLTKSVVSKLLADPITFLRTSDDREAANAVSRLFGLLDTDNQTQAGPEVEAIKGDDA
ncbi:MAG TPA: glutamyl-tRNA reductase [Dehalococcoidia bacterium]|nr:glutamyl-tRNA reductase [Dehalococcoidia bacterium]MDP6273207.1 glutamyl-tRNA reductase [Dehalococcoidia bacterium]MDP7160916.1 glutamyl-tRNA reductase [Dehalococcoidia bacterium]MDP7212970.1 glutamyl-tRNA reductase [Dehalococcoidia bacterium]MDP7514768.1 glutamyl-tRNA reductase [Dehalococcoidia bacterium]